MSGNDPAKEEPQQQQAGPDFRGLWSDRTTITTLALFGFVIIRVLLVTRGDVPAALAIISGVGVVTVVVSTIVGSIPLLTVIGISILFFLLMAGRVSDFRRDTLAIPTIAILIGIAFLTTPWVPLLWFGAIPIGVLIWRHFSWSRLPGGWSQYWLQMESVGQRIVVIVVILALLELLVIISAFAPVWLPAEVIKTSNHGQIVGYVLGEEGDWFSVLREKPRIILRIEKTQIKERTVCLTRNQANVAERTPFRAISRLLGRPTQSAEPLCP